MSTKNQVTWCPSVNDLFCLKKKNQKGCKVNSLVKELCEEKTFTPKGLSANIPIKVNFTWSRATQKYCQIIL